jgi:hypothetical protein
MSTAADVQRELLTSLEKLRRFAKQCEDDGPDYGDAESTAAFSITWSAVEANAPRPGESVTAYRARVQAAAQAALEKAGNQTPASFEALAAISRGPSIA